MFVAGWRHALRSEWPFIIIIINHNHKSLITLKSIPPANVEYTSNEEHTSSHCRAHLVLQHHATSTYAPAGRLTTPVHTSRSRARVAQIHGASATCGLGCPITVPLQHVASAAPSRCLCNMWPRLPHHSASETCVASAAQSVMSWINGGVHLPDYRPTYCCCVCGCCAGVTYCSCCCCAGVTDDGSGWTADGPSKLEARRHLLALKSMGGM